MLHLALAALLAGAPLSGDATAAPDNDEKKVLRTEATVGVSSDEAPISQTYAYGRTERTPFKLWVGYGWAQTEGRYDATGDEVDLGAPVAAGGDITSQRAFVGAQVNFINLANFSVGIGGQLMLAQVEAAGVLRGVNPATGEPIFQAGDTGFGLQKATVFAEARGRVLGLHGGYVFDLAEEPGTQQEPARSDLRDAILIGASFDYPAPWLRLFGGVDYFHFVDTDDLGVEGIGWDDPSLLAFNMGAGVRFAFIELGAAALIRTNHVVDRFGQRGGGHQGSIAPYLTLSPQFIPASISIRGAFMSDYVDSGFGLGGSKDLVPGGGFTVAATFGF